MRTASLLLALCLLVVTPLGAQDAAGSDESRLRFSGQLSVWGMYTPDSEARGWMGGRYIPQLNYGIPFADNKLLDFEGSANVLGELGFRPSASVYTHGKIRPYRLWARYSTARSELRLGLQKLNFGSAMLFRPLMWFDGMDPRDPLQMTDGVWGGLYRYYFPSNANLWLWLLAGNDDLKGWEMFKTAGSIRPEGGGRFQLPIPSGEAALSYHFRRVNTSALPAAPSKAGEHRVGLDLRADVVVGLWLEASWTHAAADLGPFTNQQMITLGTDYTFAVGSGLGLTAEHAVYAAGRNAFHFGQGTHLTGLSLTYPLSLSDNLGAIFYYDWRSDNLYSFLNWHWQSDHISLYAMAFWNPRTVALPSQADYTRFAGKGIQIMIVWNH